jgi:hypothetical protein
MPYPTHFSPYPPLSQSQAYPPFISVSNANAYAPLFDLHLSHSDKISGIHDYKLFATYATLT